MFGNTHGDHQFKDEHRPIEHCCRKENEKLKYNTLIETNIQGELKYRDEKDKITQTEKISEIGLHIRKLK